MLIYTKYGKLYVNFNSVCVKDILPIYDKLTSETFKQVDYL